MQVGKTEARVGVVHYANLLTMTTETLSASTAESTEEAIMGNHIDVVETVISSLAEDQSAMVSHTDDGYLWKFKYGSVEVFVQLTGLKDEDMLAVWSPVLKLPAKNELELMRLLLEMNWSETFEACFSIMDNEVVVQSTRTLEGLNPSEVSRLITIVATIADDHDEDLAGKFGA